VQFRLVHLAAVLSAAALVLAGCGSSASTSPGYGAQGDPTKADRTVEVRQLDTLHFDPATIQIKVGETVRFRVTNTGTGVHEFTLGDQSIQDQQDQQMKSMGANMQMPDISNRIDVSPGQSKDLVWTFPTKRTTVIYACHEPGHFAAGMKGLITVT